MRLLLLAALAATSSLAAQPTVREYLIPRASAFPHDPAVGADGIVWYTGPYPRDGCSLLVVGS